MIGGGVIGLSCALSLRSRGFEVTVVDAGEMGAGASWGNGGWICPSLSGPVPAPGVVWQGIKWLLKSDSPLLVRPGLKPEVWSWLAEFARHCNSHDFLAGLAVVGKMAATSTSLFRALEDRGVQFEIHRDGLLLLFRRLSSARLEMDALTFMESLGCPRAEWTEPGQLGELEPVAGSGSLFGILAPQDEHVRPESLVSGLTGWLSANGVTLRSGVTVTRLEMRGSRAVCAFSGEGEELEADAYVVAAGVESQSLVRSLGVHIPLLGGKGYSLTLESSAPRLVHPLYLAEARVAISPYRAGIRILGTMELGTASFAVNQGRVAAMVRACQRDLPRLEFRGTASSWAGMRPMVPDGLPVIGFPGRVENLVLATGHAMLGVTLAPGTGELVADILEQRQLPEFASHLSPNRFLGRNHDRSRRSVPRVTQSRGA